MYVCAADAAAVLTGCVGGCVRCPEPRKNLVAVTLPGLPTLYALALPGSSAAGIENDEIVPEEQVSVLAANFPGVEREGGAAAQGVLLLRYRFEMAQLVAATMGALAWRRGAYLRIVTQVINLGVVAGIVYQAHVHEAVDIDRNLLAPAHAIGGGAISAPAVTASP